MESGSLVELQLGYWDMKVGRFIPFYIFFSFAKTPLPQPPKTPWHAKIAELNGLKST
jgi:hypothetical protein